MHHFPGVEYEIRVHKPLSGTHRLEEMLRWLSKPISKIYKIIFILLLHSFKNENSRQRVINQYIHLCQHICVTPNRRKSADATEP